LKTDFEQIKKVLGRCLRLRCPACGESRIVTQPFHIRHHCPNCLALFKREDGFFVGAILANVVTTELVILLVCFFFLLIVGAGPVVCDGTRISGRLLSSQLEPLARIRLHRRITTEVRPDEKAQKHLSQHLLCFLRFVALCDYTPLSSPAR
jgi:ribosomal protein S27E